MKSMTRRALTLSAAFLSTFLFLTAARAQDERSLTDPTGWYWYYNQTPAALSDVITNTGSRIVDLEVSSTSPLLFTAALVVNSGPYAKGWWWYYGLTEADVSQKITENNARIIDLEAYDAGGSTRFAIVLVPNTGADAKAWWWYYGVQPADIQAAYEANGARLIDLDTYVIGGRRYWSAVMIANSG